MTIHNLWTFVDKYFKGCTQKRRLIMKTYQYFQQNIHNTSIITTFKNTCILLTAFHHSIQFQVWPAVEVGFYKNEQGCICPIDPQGTLRILFYRIYFLEDVVICIYTISFRITIVLVFILLPRLSDKFYYIIHENNIYIYLLCSKRDN